VVHLGSAFDQLPPDQIEQKISTSIISLRWGVAVLLTANAWSEGDGDCKCIIGGKRRGFIARSLMSGLRAEWNAMTVNMASEYREAHISRQCQTRHRRTASGLTLTPRDN